MTVCHDSFLEMIISAELLQIGNKVTKSSGHLKNAQKFPVILPLIWLETLNSWSFRKPFYRCFDWTDEISNWFLNRISFSILPHSFCDTHFCYVSHFCYAVLSYWLSVEPPSLIFVTTHSLLLRCFRILKKKQKWVGTVCKVSRVPNREDMLF